MTGVGAMSDETRDARDDAAAAATAPVTVVTRTFPARPSSWPEARDFLVETLAEAGPEHATSRVVQESIGQALLASASPRIGAFQISVRVFPDEVQIEVLAHAPAEAEPRARAQPPASFAAWLSGVLAEAGLSQEQAADRLGVSVRTIGRWVRGETEPRMRDARRVTETFGS